MQVKIVIGTVAFMLTMMVLGFASLREPARLEETTLAAAGRSIETGAHIFQSNCATCHGVNGTAQECYDAGGNQIGCQGFPLNTYNLLCGDASGRSRRMDDTGWEGTKADFVRNAVAAGRVNAVMPAWSERFGGPFRDDQVEDVSAYVLNWESTELCATPPPEFPWPDLGEDFLIFPEFETPSGDVYPAILPGDASRGGELYVTYGCSGCHGDITQEASAAVGPWLGEIAEVGSSRVEGQSAANYVYQSILEPSAYIAEVCPTGPCAGPPSSMPGNFASRMADLGQGNSPQDLADIMAYLGVIQ